MTIHDEPETGLRSATVTAAPGGTVSRALRADLSAVREARSVVQQVLRSWRADEMCDDVALVASELVANALRHGIRSQPSRRSVPGSPSCAEGVRISLVRTRTHVICSVTDPSGEPPIRQLADTLDGSGRGLQLVESLSLCWGWTMLVDEPDDDDRGAGTGLNAGGRQGKTVWAIFPLDLTGHQVQAVGAA